MPVGIREAYSDSNKLDVNEDAITLLDLGNADRWRVEFATREPVTGKTFYLKVKG